MSQYIMPQRQWVVLEKKKTKKQKTTLERFEKIQLFENQGFLNHS